MQLAPIRSAGHKAVRGGFAREREEAAQDGLTMRMVGVVALDMKLDALSLVGQYLSRHRVSGIDLRQSGHVALAESGSCSETCTAIDLVRIDQLIPPEFLDFGTKSKAVIRGAHLSALALVLIFGSHSTRRHRRLRR